MQNAFDGLSPLQILPYMEEALQHHYLQDHLYFRDYSPHSGQLQFHELGLVAKERMIRAANRWGKSMSASAEVSMHLTGNYPEWWSGHRYTKPVIFWVAGVTNAETFNTIAKYYVGDPTETGWIHPGLIVNENKKSHIYYIQHSSGGVSELRFKSYEQKRKAFQGATIDGIHFDEEPPFDIYTEGLTRTMATEPGHHGMIILSMTPLEGVTHMVLHFSQVEECEEESSDPVFRNLAPGEVINSRTYVTGGWEDAPHLSEEEKSRLLSAYDEHEREARTKGIPAIGSGLIYPLSEAEYVCSPIKIEDHWPRFFGLDFGWHHPTAAVFMAHDQDNDVVYAYAEYAASRLTPQHHAYELMKQGADWIPGAFDHAGKSASQVDGSNVVDLYKQAGLRNLIPADKRSVNEGIYTILQRMENGKFKVFRTLNKLLTEIRMYARDNKGMIKKGNDDLCDAMRYGMVSALPKARVKPSRVDHQVSSGYSPGSWMQF